MRRMTVLMLAALAASAARADEWTDPDTGYKWTYVVNNGAVNIYGGSYTAAITPAPYGVVAVPAVIDGKLVTGIGDFAFASCSGLTGVEIPEKVTSIGAAAFYKCSGLKSVTLPEGVSVVGYYTFGDCSALERVTFGSGVTSIGNGSFSGCKSLVDVAIPDTVTSVGDEAFNGCSGLRRVTIGSAVESMGYEVFQGCSSLECLAFAGNAPKLGSSAFYKVPSTCTVYVTKDSTGWDVAIPGTWEGLGIDYALSDTDYESANGFKWKYRFNCGTAEIRGVARLSGTTTESVTIPLTLGGKPVTRIGEYGFLNLDFTSVTIPDSVTIIADSAFRYCNNLTSITIPDSVTSIGAYAFHDCSALESATVGDGVISIGESAFRSCDVLASVTFGSGVASIGTYAFAECDQLKSLAIPDGVTVIRDGTFSSCVALESVTIPDSVTRIERFAFSECGDQLFDTSTIPGVKLVDGWAAGPAGTLAGPLDLTGVRGIVNNAFENCKKLTSVTLPDGLTHIGRYAFAFCSGLTSVTVPDSVTDIGFAAFKSCIHLEKAVVPAVLKGTLDPSVFEKCAEGLEIVYHEIFTVTFDPNGGAVGETSRDVDSVTPAVGALPTPARDGYDFVGWFTAASGGTKVTSATVVAADVTYYAQWKEKVATHKVTFNANGGSGGTSRTVNHGAAVGELPKATRNGYTLKGWFTAATGGTKVTSATVVTADVTYYAQWTKNPDPENPDPENPEPVSPGPGGTDPENPDPSNPDPSDPGAGPCYEPLKASDIVEPFAAPKPVTIQGVAYDGCDPVAVVELKLAKVNVRRLTGKVSGTVTGLDGKRHAIKALKLTGLDGTAPVSVSLEVKGMGTMAVTIGGTRFAGSLGDLHVQSAKVGGAWTGASASVDIAVGDLSMFTGRVLEGLLPSGETAGVAAGRWAFAKAAGVKWAKPKRGAAPPELYDAASGKGLIVDESRGKTNLSGLKLAYTAKKGTFKGSFKLYELQGEGARTKLKKYTVNVNGLVVDGKGRGQASCRKPAAGPWPVTVK